MSRRAALSLLIAVAAGLPAVAGCASAVAPRTASPPAAASAAASPGSASPTSAGSASPSCPPGVRGLGTVAITTRQGIELLDMAGCSVTRLAGPGAQAPSFSPSGRWLAYSRAAAYPRPEPPVVVPVTGGAPRRPLGSAVLAWTWARHRDLLYGVTAGGEVLAAPAAGGRRRVLARLGRPVYPDLPLALSPDGDRLAVDLSDCDVPDFRQPVGELATVELRTGRRSLAIEQMGSYLTLAGFSPDGRWLLYWRATMCSASLAADGWPLYAVRTSGAGQPVHVVRSMLLYDDFLSWCGRRLVAAAGPDRETQIGSRLLRTGPPAWQERVIRHAARLSWVSPACSPSGSSLVAAAGSRRQISFGEELRSIWLLGSSGRMLRRLDGPPPVGLSDEDPRFSPDGRWVMFVRARVLNDGSEDTLELVPADGSAPAISILDFASQDISYYDHFDFASEIAWHAAS